MTNASPGGGDCTEFYCNSVTSCSDNWRAEVFLDGTANCCKMYSYGNTGFTCSKNPTGD